MSIFSNVTEQDLDNLRKLAKQQKNQRDLKIENRILKYPHDIRLAESLSPITTRLDEIKDSTQNSGDVIKTSQAGTPQLPFENAITTHQPIEHNEAVVYDVELENTLQNMKDYTGFFKTHHDPQRGWMINKYLIKMSRGTEVEINDIT